MNNFMLTTLLVGCMIAQYSLCLSLDSDEEPRLRSHHPGTVDESRSKTKTSGSKLFARFFRCGCIRGSGKFDEPQVTRDEEKLNKLLLIIKFGSRHDLKLQLMEIKSVHRYLNCPFVQEPNNELTTMLHVAIEREKSHHSCKIIELLMDNGASATGRNGAGETPLHLLVQQPHFALFEVYASLILKDDSVDVNALDNQQRTPLQCLPEAQSLEEFQWNLDIAIFLDEIGADFNVLDVKGRRLDIYGMHPRRIPGKTLRFSESAVLRQSVVGRFEPLLIRNVDSIPESKKEQLSDLVCPISLDVPRNPVLASDGFTYNFEDLDNWAATSADNIPSPTLSQHHIKIPSPILRDRHISTIVYSNVVVSRIFRNWEKILQEEKEWQLLTKFKHEMPYLCRDGKTYTFSEIPEQYQRESSCYLNLVLHQLVAKALELRKTR